MTGPAIEVRDLSVVYRLARHPASDVKEFALRRIKRQVVYDELWALRDVSFTVDRGEVLGVVGGNGAGKSTLMKAVGGIIRPSHGRVIVRGHITPILGLGAGLHPDLTGAENIVLLAALLGRDTRRARARAPAIAEWAGLTGYLDVPLRAYSSGMTARLSFAVVADERPDVLLLDEILAVGDADFQVRSGERVRELIGGGTTVIIVSHDLATIADWSARVLWLEGGRTVRVGDPKAVTRDYLARITGSPSPPA